MRELTLDETLEVSGGWFDNEPEPQQPEPGNSPIPLPPEPEVEPGTGDMVLPCCGPFDFFTVRIPPETWGSVLGAADGAYPGAGAAIVAPQPEEDDTGEN